MEKLVLTYFDFSGGRAEAARLALHIGNIEFDDVRFSFDKFSDVRKSTPLNQVPTLSIDGRQVTQCNAINRYVAKRAGLYPSNDFDALLCDEIMEALEDVTDKLVATFGLQGDAMKDARQGLVEGSLTQYLTWMQGQLENAGGQYFVDNQLSIADLKVFVWISSLNAGFLEHIPATLVEHVAPLLNAHHHRISKIDSIVQYYQKLG